MGFNKSYQKYKGRSKGENVDQPVSLSRLSTCLQAHNIVFKRGGGGNPKSCLTSKTNKNSQKQKQKTLQLFSKS